MPSTPSNSLRLEEQFTGENVNLWGVLLNQVIAMLDGSIAGLSIIALTSNYTLTSKNFVADEARNAILKLTGTAPWTVTIPSVSKIYVIWNASSAVQTITTGAGATVAIDPSDIVLVICDGSAVMTLGFAGLSLKAYIAAAALGATGQLPAQLGNSGKFVKTDGTNAAWVQPATTDLSDIAALKGYMVSLAAIL